MPRTDANPPLPFFPGDYLLTEVESEYLARSVKPKLFLHIDQSECIMCEGCVDICPWKCIHMLSTGAVTLASNTEQPGADPSERVVFVVDEDVCTRCGLCVDRCPTGVIIMGKAGVAAREGDAHQRDSRLGYAYGVRY
jgi:ferredoxin